MKAGCAVTQSKLLLPGTPKQPLGKAQLSSSMIEETIRRGSKPENVLRGRQQVLSDDSQRDLYSSDRMDSEKIAATEDLLRLPAGRSEAQGTIGCIP